MCTSSRIYTFCSSQGLVTPVSVYHLTKFLRITPKLLVMLLFLKAISVGDFDNTQKITSNNRQVFLALELRFLISKDTVLFRVTSCHFS